jgi:signal transduction histidine kinase
LAEAKSIAMTLDAASPLPFFGDGDLMREALSNLIDNAVKFTPSSGAVRISATTDAGRPVIRVGDSGSGVEPGERDKIFDRFYRISRDDRVPGSGLGLSIAAAIARLHGFDLKVSDNRPGALFELAARAGPTQEQG